MQKFCKFAVNLILRMKNLFILIVWLLAATVAFAKSEVDSLLVLLNNEIDNKHFYDQQKKHEIQEVKRLLTINHLQPEQEYELNHELAEQYKKYIIDSAIYYTEKNLQIATALNDTGLVSKANLELSQLYSTAGMYIEAKNILNSICRETLPDELLPFYFETNSLFYGHYAQSNDRYIYFRQNELYRDSLLMVLDSSSLYYKITYASKLLHEKHLDVAEEQLLHIFNQISEQSPDYAIVAYLLGIIYQMKDDTDLQKKYMALSAIVDIRNSIKDNASIQSLALIYYKSDKIDQAYKFMKSAIDDIDFCHVRFRSIELSSVYSIINTAYLEKEAKQKRELQLYLLLISILSLFLIIAISYVYKQMRKVSKIQNELFATNLKLTELNQSISSSNDQLQRVNAQLLESNHIKETYIAHFFDMCSTYIDTLEDYRKMLNKKAVNNQHKELFEILKSTILVEDERKKLYGAFDNIFLNLYPTFVENFNSLLNSEGQVLLKPGELLNTELRIFALIRLGITDSTKIAGFLRCSLRTIYNYRSKARNNAVVSRDEFEETVMKIGVISEKR